MQLLNGYYIGKEGAECRYCNGYSQETCSNTCTTESLKESNMKVLTNIAKSMIDESVWDTYGVIWPKDNSEISFSNQLYLQEKGISEQKLAKMCTADDSYCSDKVNRTTSWTGLVGLRSAADITYAAGWLYNASGLSLYSRSITPRAFSGRADSVWASKLDVIGSDSACGYYSIFPSLYLKSDIQIIGGDGDIEPYIMN